MEEIFKDIPNYKGMYQVSNIGRIKSLKYNREKILKGGVDTDGYFQVLLCKNGTRKSYKNHQLVAIAFLNHKRCGMNMVVNHKDFNKQNNHVDNLEIVTTRENSNLKHIQSSSQYVGVTWDKSAKKWRSRLYIGKKAIHLGRFEYEIDAHNAYQKALSEL